MKIESVAANARALGWSVRIEKARGVATIAPRVFDPYSDSWRETYAVMFDPFTGEVTGSTEIRTIKRSGPFSEPVLSNLYELRQRDQYRKKLS